MRNRETITNEGLRLFPIWSFHFLSDFGFRISDLLPRCLAFLAGAAIVWSGLLSAPGQAQERIAKAKRSYQVLNVFQRHCLKCHGDEATGGVRILDHALLVQQRQVIRPGSPDASELFDLVQGGSMPPGDNPKVPQNDIDILKAWIGEGAGSLPSMHNESYVLWSIVSDLGTLNEEQQRSIRYLSLNHVLGGENAGARLAETRQLFERVLGVLVPEGNPPPRLQSIEPTNSVFRIDLRDLGWDRQPYTEKENPKADKRWLALNLYDLILLEYPHGRLPIESAFYPELLKYLRLLQQAGQVRPIPYLRADWLIEVMAQPRSPVYSDFLKVLGRPPDTKLPRIGSTPADPPGRLAIINAPDGGGSEETSSRPPESSGALPRGSLPDPDETKRRAFHEHLAMHLDRDKGSGLSILPLDGLTYHPEPRADVQFRAIEFKKRGLDDPPAKHPFAPGDRMTLWISTKWNVEAEVIHTAVKEGQKSKVSGGTFQGQAGKPIWLSKEGGFTITLPDGVEQDLDEYTLYAYPADALKANNAKFPQGTILQAEGIHARVVHLFYQVRPDGQGFEPPDADKMVKLTIRVTTKR